MRRTIEVLSVCALTAMFLGNLFAEPPQIAIPPEVAAEDQQSAEESGPQIAEEVRQRLHQPISLDVNAMTLRDAITDLLDKSKIDVAFDTDIIQQADEAEVTCKLHHVSIRAALKRILSPAKLSWVCDDAGVRIVSEEVARKTLVTRVYDIAPLLEGPTVEIVLPQGANLQQTQFGGYGPPSSSLPPEEKHVKSAKDSNTAERNLIEMIQNVTGGVPDTPWLETDGEGGSIHFVKTTKSKLLVIRQTELVQVEIENLLNELIAHHNDTGEAEEPEPASKTASRTRPRTSASIVRKSTNRIPGR